MAWINACSGFVETRSISVVDGHRHGGLFFPLKNLLVAAGWTVEGSGDGLAAYEYRGVTGGAGTGPGGVYDVWTQDTGSHGGIGNVSNSDTWCVLKDPGGGMEILLAGMYLAGATYDMWGSIYSSWVDGYSSSGTNASTAPGNPTDELIILGYRTGSAVSPQSGIVSTTGDNFLAMRAQTAPVNGVYAFWWTATRNGNGDLGTYCFLMPLEGTRPWELHPYAFWSYYGPNARVLQWEGKGQAWEVRFNQASDGSILGTQFWKGGGQPDPVSGAIMVGDATQIGRNGQAQEHLRGVYPFMLTRSKDQDGAATVVNYPDYTQPDANGTVWLFLASVNDLLIPWDETASPPDPPGQLTATERTVDFWRVAEQMPAAGDSVPPVLTGLSPAAGSRIAKGQAISFDVTDETALRDVIVMVEYTSGIYEVVHDGVKFSAAFAAGSTRTSIVGGWGFSLLRANGWSPGPTFRVQAIDTGGNEVS